MALNLTRRHATIALAAAAAGPALPRAVAADNAPGAYATATDLVAALAARKISARELLDSTISRINAIDPKVNAVVVRDFDRARSAADAADAALDRGERRPLLGLPMTVKEQFNVAGLPTTWGIPKFRDYRPDADAVAVQRLKQAGAIIIGKTNVPTGLSDWQSFNEIYGTTNNPWDFGRTPGGSSGGAAAALAAGFVALELGSDIGGSLRAPAHYCGVLAHKPSLDLIPERGGNYPRTQPVASRGDMAVTGPMARTAPDLALELGVLAGPDELLDGVGYKLALPPPRHDKLADFRVLVLDKHPLCPTADSVVAAVDGLADRLAKAGCAVSRTNPKMPDLARTTRNYVELLAAIFSADLSPDERARSQAAMSSLSPDNLSLDAAWLRGLTMSHAAWINTNWVRNGLTAGWRALLRDVDVILCPPMPTPAFPHDHTTPQRLREVEINGAKVPYDNQIAWCGIATSTGLPSTAMPIGRSDTALPIGVQIIGGYLEDYTTITFAGLIEREFGGFTPPPNL